MNESLSILLVAHGFPPRETAGTERHTEALANELRARGHKVNIVAATRAPGSSQYDRMDEPGVVRIVNNIATRALADGESDPIIDAILRTEERRIQPDIVHVHHIQFLSSTMKFEAPTIVTLHDQWAWCPSGGLGLRMDEVCPGPEAHECARCHAQWRPAPSKTAKLLTKTASILSPLIAPNRLHTLYKKIPAALRPSPVRGDEKEEDEKAAEYRNQKTLSWYKSADALISPSRHLAELAEAHDLGPVHVIPHGLEAQWFHSRPTTQEPRPYVHIGTISFHKGTDRVVGAWRAACDEDGPPLELYGPVLEPEAAAGHPVGPILNRGEVRDTLANARALILGARWAENAPLIILEARAMGCPVIAPNIGGISEIIEDGKDGILYDTDEELTAAIQRPLSWLKITIHHHLAS